VRSGLAGLISLIPHGVGSAINEMLTQLSQRRLYERLDSMLDEMGRRIHDLGKERVIPDWFKGEEFQTLIFEAFNQLPTINDKARIKMLGNGLANSGATEFTEETRKHLFLQLVRALTPQHIACLHRLVPRMDERYSEKMRWDRRPEIEGDGADLLILQMLAADGLVEERLQSLDVREPSVGSNPSLSDVTRAVRQLLKDLNKPPIRDFRLSELGRDFLKFVGSEQDKHEQT
jgi:hypothetical protein